MSIRYLSTALGSIVFVWSAFALAQDAPDAPISIPSAEFEAYVADPSESFVTERTEGVPKTVAEAPPPQEPAVQQRAEPRRFSSNAYSDYEVVVPRTRVAPPPGYAYQDRSGGDRYDQRRYDERRYDDERYEEERDDDRRAAVSVRTVTPQRYRTYRDDNSSRRTYTARPSLSFGFSLRSWLGGREDDNRGNHKRKHKRGSRYDD